MAETTHIQATEDGRFYARTLRRIVGWDADGEELAKSGEVIVGSAQGQGAETVWDMGEPNMPFQYWSSASTLAMVGNARLLAHCLEVGLITIDNAYVKQAREQKLPPVDRLESDRRGITTGSDVAAKDEG